MANTTKGSRRYYKAFNFDLIIAELKTHYTGGHHTKAYRDIQVFMKKNGFEHRQGSGYRSSTPLDNTDVLDIVDRLYATFPWFAECVNKFDVTNVGEVYDLALMYQKVADVETEIAPQPKQQKKSVLKQLEDSKKIADEHNSKRTPKKKNQDHEL